MYQYQMSDQTMGGSYYGQQYPQQLHVPMAAGAGMPGVMPTTMPYPGVPDVPQVSPEGFLPLEQSYIENILRFNRGKVANFYMTFEYNPEWPARVFRGVVEEAGRDHIIVSNRDLEKYYLLLMVNLDYVEFDEPIEYIAPALPWAPPAQQR